MFRAVSAHGLEAPIKPGDARPLDSVYCRPILSRRLPNMIRDTGDGPAAQALDITRTVLIGSHVSVPVRQAGRAVWGMFCSLSPRPNPMLTERDREMMDLLALNSAREVNAGLAARSRRDRILAATEAAMAGGVDLVFQPICDLKDRRVTGFAVLARFRGEPRRSPDIRFAEAAEVGLGPALECAVLRAAMTALDHLPEGQYLSLLRVAVDDAGAGYAGLQQILRLRPDIIKLDMSLARDIDRDSARVAGTGAGAALRPDWRSDHG